jgi:hypothetical protein
MQNAIGRVICAVYLLSSACLVAASMVPVVHKETVLWGKRLLWEAVGPVLKRDLVEIVAGYMGPEYEKKRSIAASVLCAKLAKAGISQQNYGDCLPPEILLHILKFVGTQYVLAQDVRFPYELGPIARCRRGNIAVLTQGAIRLFNAKNLKPMGELTFDREVLKEDDRYLRELGIQRAGISIEKLSRGRIAVASQNRIWVWMVALNTCIQKFTCEKPVIGLQMLSNNCMASASENGSIKIWDLAKGICIRTLEHGSPISNAVAALSHNRLASRSYRCPSNNNVIKIWDINSGACLHKIPADETLGSCLTAVSGDRVAVEFRDGAIRMLDSGSGEWVQEITSPQGPVVFSLKALPGNRLAVNYNLGSTKIWDLSSGRLLQTIPFVKGQSVFQVVPLPGSRLMVCGASSIRLYRDVIDCNYRR